MFKVSLVRVGQKGKSVPARPCYLTVRSQPSAGTVCLFVCLFVLFFVFFLPFSENGKFYRPLVEKDINHKKGVDFLFFFFSFRLSPGELYPPLPAPTMLGAGTEQRDAPLLVCI